MIKLGDIVTPNDCCWGHGYLFKVCSLARTMGCENKYKLQRIEQSLDLRKGPSKEQLAIIQQVEDSLWSETELESIEPTVETKIKIDKMNKEENNMDILRLYEGRKGEEIYAKYLAEREKILKEDEIQSIIIEMENQVNTILENQNLRGRLKVNSEELHTAETEIKLEELKNRIDAERKELRSTLEEIRALFEMTNSYEERIKILKNYGLLNKVGKFNI